MDLSILQLKELNCDNIRSFIGACVDPGHICYLTQWCSRGTVQVSVTDVKYEQQTRPQVSHIV